MRSITNHTEFDGRDFWRPRTKPATVLLMHATAGSSLSGALQTLKEKKLSYHFIVDKDGSVHKLVGHTRVAFHAGKSIGPEGKGVNEYSIGVSFVNRNDGRDPYTPEQMEAAVWLAEILRKAVSSLKWTTTHRDVSLTGKTDPRGFDMETFAARTGLQLWRRERG